MASTAGQALGAIAHACGDYSTNGDADHQRTAQVDILLLRRQGARWTAQQRNLLPDGVRDSPASHLLLECKLTESANMQSFQQAVGYDYFYRQAQSLSAAEVQSFVLSARTPRPAVLHEFGYSVTDQPGVYQSTQGVLQPIRLIVLNELMSVPHNAFVQCFASKRPVRVTAFQAMEQMPWETFDEPFWDYVAGLRNVAVGKGITMNEEAINALVTPEAIMEIGKKMRKSLLATVTPQELRQLIDRLPAAERLAGLDPEERLAGLAPEELLALMKQIEVYLRQRQPETATTQSQTKSAEDD